MKRFLITTTSILTLTSIRPLLAAEAPTPDVVAGVSVEQVVVSATRSPQPRDRIGSSITILTRDVIESSQTIIVSDLLAQAPGVTFSRNGDVGGVTAIRIRGAEADQTTVIIDGVKLNDPSATGGGYNFANLLAGDIDRIEVLRGAQSTLWGSQAMGGVVNIITAEPTTAFEGVAEVEGGSRNTASGMLAVGGASDRVVWRLAGSKYVTDGLSAFALGQEGDGYQNAGLTGRLRVNVTEKISLDLRGFYARGHNQSDGFPAPAFAFADTAEYTKTEELLGYAGVNFALLDSRLKNRVAYTHTDTNRDSYNPDQAVTPVTFDAAGRNKRWEYQGSFGIADGWDAIFGVEHEKSSFRTASPSAFAPNPVPAVASAELTSGYGQIQAEVVPHLTLTGGLRYDDHETFGGRALGQAAAAWSLNDGDTVLRASFGQGFKAPSLYQLFSIYGNTGLRPEEADSFDLGVEQRFMDNMIVVSATGFHRTTRNQIDFVSCPGTHPLCTPAKFGVYDNVARTKAQGIELTGSATVEAFSFQANYTYTDNENTSPGNVNRGKDLARRPRHTANLSATYVWPADVSTGIAVRYVGDSFDNAANNFTLEDYTLVDLRAAWQINEAVELYGRIENLFDESYVTTRNYGTAGRGAFAGVRARF